MAETTDTGAAPNAPAPAPNAPSGARKTREQYLPQHMVFEGEGYGPGLATVPESFPKWADGTEEAMQDREATLLAAYQRDKEEFAAWRDARTQGVPNDAGLAQPESGDPAVRNFGTPTGSNHGLQTGVVDEGSVPANAASKREGDRLSEASIAKAPATPAGSAPVARPLPATAPTAKR